MDFSPVEQGGSDTMATQLHERIQDEVELIQRFAGAYGKKFDEMIARMNAPAPTSPADGQCLRLCVEAVNMVLSLQGHMARVLDEISRHSMNPSADA
jgi:hypothetical protein